MQMYKKHKVMRMTKTLSLQNMRH